MPDSICEATARFISKRVKHCKHYISIADIGEKNKKAKYVLRSLNKYMIDFTPLDSSDFNTEDFQDNSMQDVILCLEVLEHVQNPLFLMENIAKRLDQKGTLFLSTPARPRMFYPDFHFHEIGAKRLQRWILDPVGMKIVSKQRLRIPHRWTFYLSGFRPFLRLFFDYTNIYEIKNK